MQQKAYSFDSETVEKILKGAIIAGFGALLTYILQAISGMDFGSYTPIVVALSGIAVNAVKEYVQGEQHGYHV